jgi:hypothetical protein
MIRVGARVEWCKAHGYNQPGTIVRLEYDLAGFTKGFFVQWDGEDDARIDSYDERDLAENGGNITFEETIGEDLMCVTTTPLEPSGPTEEEITAASQRMLDNFGGPVKFTLAKPEEV